MSVAFRRESDEEHVEPRFEIPIAPGRNVVTERGLTLILEKIADIEESLDGTDEAARASLERDLRYWRTRAATAEVAPPPRSDIVGIGSRVTVRLNGTIRTIGIVGGDEADPAAGTIAFGAPLARALIGAEAGEIVSFAGRRDAIEILSID